MRILLFVMMTMMLGCSKKPEKNVSAGAPGTSASSTTSAVSTSSETIGGIVIGGCSAEAVPVTVAQGHGVESLKALAKARHMYWSISCMARWEADPKKLYFAQLCSSRCNDFTHRYQYYAEWGSSHEEAAANLVTGIAKDTEILLDNTPLEEKPEALSRQRQCERDVSGGPIGDQKLEER